MLRQVMIFCGLVLLASFAFIEGIAGRRAPAPEEPAPIVGAARTEQSKPAASQSGRQVAIQANGQGHFESDFRLNSRRVHALIDTGATLVAMNETTARQAGIFLSDDDFRHSVQTANGPTRAASVTLESVQIGGITVRDVEAVVLEDQALRTVLVGMSFLRRLKSYEANGRRLVLNQ